MAEFVDVIKEGARMCQAQPDDCDGCPLIAMDADAFCMMLRDVSRGLCLYRDVEKYESLVMDWAAAHPRKTMLDVFYEHFPRAERLSNGTLRVCPHHLDPSWGGLCDNGKAGDCRACWAREVKE